MDKTRSRVAIVAAFCLGVVFALAITVFTGTARASRSNEYRIVKSAGEVVRLGESGWEYVGLAPGGQGVMKK